VKSTLKTMLAADKTKSFSTVSQQTAEDVLRQLRIKELDGNVVDPIIVSDGVECTSFDMSRYHNEEEGTPDLMHHHQEQLSLCGLPFGRDGYAMYDARQIRCSQFMVSNQVFKGTTDCILAPCGLLGASPWTCMRVGFEHKQCRKQAVPCGKPMHLRFLVACHVGLPEPGYCVMVRRDRQLQLSPSL
jgi:hypothetical protein